MRLPGGLVRRVVVGLLTCATPWSPDALAARFEVGSVAKSLGAAPAVQVVPHRLGETPVALLIWSDGRGPQSVGNDAQLSMGICDGTSCASAAIAAANGVSPSNTSRRLAPVALTLVQPGEVVRAEATLDAWNSTSFTLRWTTNDASPAELEYLVISGPEVKAKLVRWAMPGDAGVLEVTGVGFQPDAIVSMDLGSSSSVFPDVRPSVHLDLGVADRLGHQWVTGLYAQDNQSSSNSSRYQRTDAMLGVAQGGNFYIRAALASMTGDGFRADFVTPSSAGPAQVLTLALGGVAARGGSFAKSTAAAPSMQAVTGVGGAPRALLVASFQSPARTTAIAGAALGVGLSDGVTQAAFALRDTDAANPTSAIRQHREDRLLVSLDPQSSASTAEAALTSFDADGFSLAWTVNDAQASEQLYLALAPAAGGGGAGGGGGSGAGGGGGAGGAGGSGSAGGGTAGGGSGSGSGSVGGGDGAVPLSLRVGCGCSAPGPGALALLALAVARRRRRSS